MDNRKLIPNDSGQDPEGALDWLIQHGGLTQKILEKKLAAMRGDTGRKVLEAATAESSSASAREKILPPEQAEALLQTLKIRFSDNQQVLKIHEGISWREVERALRATPNLLWTVQKLEETGGEPDVLRDEGDAFRIGDFSKESPYRRRYVVYDRAADDYLREHHPTAICNGNAMDSTAEWGCELMNEEEYHLLQRMRKVDKMTSSWLRTSDEIRKTGKARLGHRYENLRHGDLVSIHTSQPDINLPDVGFRCSLRVPKV